MIFIYLLAGIEMTDDTDAERGVDVELMRAGYPNVPKCPLHQHSELRPEDGEHAQLESRDIQ